MSHDPLRPVLGGAVPPFDATATEIESRAEFDSYLAKGSLAGLVVLGLRLDQDPPDLAAVNVTVVTGGGPGMMEAANLGAYLSGRPVDDLTAAIDLLAGAPDFLDHDRYTAAAIRVRKSFPEDSTMRTGGLALPTWLYGHEPANLFAGQIGKYFSNAVREDSILRLSRGGIVFAPGWAGTVQEIFQAATKTFYRTDGPSGAFVFLGVDHWSNLPVEALLRPLLAKSPHGDQSHLIMLTDSLDEAMEAVAAG